MVGKVDSSLVYELCCFIMFLKISSSLTQYKKRALKAREP